MLKPIIVILAVSVVLISVAEIGARQDGNGELNPGSAVTSSVEGQASQHNYKDKYPKKKYYKEIEEKKFQNERDSIDEHKKRQNKKFKDHEKRHISKNEFENPLKNSKYSKFDKSQNHLDHNLEHKDVNYHDKNYESKNKEYRKKYVKQDIDEDVELVNLHHDIDVNHQVEDVGPVSLHHDIDVNYLPPTKVVSSDAEFINVNGQLNEDKKGENNEINRKKDKLNFYRNLEEIDLISVPSTNNSAFMARYIIHNVDWTPIGTVSSNSRMKGGPFVNVVSMSDGPIKKGSGVPFFFLTPKDFTSMDLNKDSRSSIAATLAQTELCKNKNIDPESPLCARVILTGKIKKIKLGTEEENFAKLALFSRHPEMEKWPLDHEWYFAKLKIKQVILLDHFGGATYVSLQDYFNVGNS